MAYWMRLKLSFGTPNPNLSITVVENLFAVLSVANSKLRDPPVYTQPLLCEILTLNLIVVKLE